MFGMTSLDVTASGWERKNLRRLFSTKYPTGGLPLCALLSLIDSEEADGTTASWLEDRYVLKQTTTKLNGLGGGAFAASGGTTANPQVIAANTDFRIYVNDAGAYDKFLVGEQIVLNQVEFTGGDFRPLSVRITALDGSKNYFTVKCDAAVSLVNPTSAISHAVLPLGAVVAEGSSMGTQQQNIRYPITVENYTQIQRDWILFTGSGVRQALDFEKSGTYKIKVKQTWQSHADALENSFLWGQKGKSTETLADGTVSERRTMGGVEWFIQEYQKAGGGAPGYRPGGAAIASTAGTFNQAEQRIFRAQANGQVAKADWEEVILPKILETTVNSSHYKLLMGGQDALLALSRYYDNKFTLNRDAKAELKLEIGVNEVVTPLGTFGFVTHPKFNQVPALRGSFFALDMGNLKFRPVPGEDTAIHTNLQDPAFLGRKDDIRTEGTLELQYPETFSIMHNLKSIV